MFTDEAKASWKRSDKYSRQEQNELLLQLDPVAHKALEKETTS